MRKALPINAWTVNRHLPAYALGVVLTALCLAPSISFATTELDRKFALERVGFLKSWDNVDGLFSDYVSSAYKDFFAHQSRFILQDVAKADTVLSNSKIAYQKLIDDREILTQVARATRSETLIRTRILKEGNLYKFQIDWLHAPGIDILTTEIFTMNEPTSGTFGAKEVSDLLQKALDRMIAKLPFIGHITGRDNNSVTVNVGAFANVRAGDTLVIATLDDVKNHPLLKTIVDWRLTRTGKIEIEQVDDRIAFGKVIEEEPGRQISRYQKIIQLIPKPIVEAPITTELEETDKDEPPRLGWMDIGPWLGSFGRQITQTTNQGRSGGGFLIGAKAEAQLWLNKSWFVEGSYGFGSWNYSQKDITTGATSALTDTSGIMKSIRFEVGYSYILGRSFFGPRGWLKAGLKNTSYTLPIVASEIIAPVSFTSVFFGLGGDVPMSSEWGILLGMNFGLFNTSASVDSVTDIGFLFGGYYKFTPKIALRVGVDIMAQGADYINGDALTHKIFAFSPALLYYF
ncbi:MAG: hypothetical protein AABZ55_09380 [Bdellovibrionota bacterium]